MRELKLLIVAEHASASFGGEALLPLQYFRCLRAMDVDVRLLVHQRTRGELEELLPKDRDRIFFVHDSAINIYCSKLGRFLPSRLSDLTLGAISHFDTQLRQRAIARSLVTSLGINVIHEPIPVSPKLPSFMYGLSAPVIIGPMNGGMDYPPGFSKDSIFTRATIRLARAMSVVSNTIIPGKKRAALLLVANSRTRAALPANCQSLPIEELVENGVDCDTFHPSDKKVASDVLRLIYVGRLVEPKRVDLLLRACGQIHRSTRFRLSIIGDGPMEHDLKMLAHQLSMTERVEFLGALPHSQTARLLANADALVLPSMREAGGAVVLEAMASGIPVIAAKWGGPVDYVTEQTGFLIPPDSPETFVDVLASCIQQISEKPEELREKGINARSRALELYDWKVKMAQLLRIYTAVLESAQIEPTRLKF